jgi:uroporphyrin-III C-methyltransferase
MLSADRSLELGLPELPYGSVWIIGAGAGDRRDLSPLAIRALGSADAVIHDPGISDVVLDLVQPPRYREAAAPHRAIERAIKLAQDGWRVVQLVDGNTLERAVESAIRCAECDVPSRILPNVREPSAGEAPLGFLLVRKLVLHGSAEPQTTVVLFTAAARREIVQDWQAPLGFSMCGVAG